MIDSSWIRLSGWPNSFTLVYPPSWVREDDEDGVITLAPQSGSVALTISAATHRNPLAEADAHSQLARFIKKLTRGPAEFGKTSQSYSTAECVDEEGWNWSIVAVAKKNTVSIVSLNGETKTEEDVKAWKEGEAILSSVT
jgi:hypothetical protein